MAKLSRNMSLNIDNARLLHDISIDAHTTATICSDAPETCIVLDLRLVELQRLTEFATPC